MKITIISGSHRVPSNSQKVAEFVRKTLLDDGLADAAEILSLGGNPLPLWDEGIWSGDEKWKTALDPVRSQCRDSDGFVVVTPEWHGQVPSGLKNLFLLLDQKDVGHKPALIVAVSAGQGGAYPIAELRMSSYKNNRLCYLPEHIIVRGADKVLNEDPADNDERSDAFYRRRIPWALNILREYALALGKVRESGVTASDEFRNGM